MWRCACRLEAFFLLSPTARVLSALGLNLSNKAETYGDPALRPVFMLNNFNYIIKALTR